MTLYIKPTESAPITQDIDPGKNWFEVIGKITRNGATVIDFTGSPFHLNRDEIADIKVESPVATQFPVFPKGTKFHVIDKGDSDREWGPYTLVDTQSIIEPDDTGEYYIMLTTDRLGRYMVFYGSEYDKNTPGQIEAYPNGDDDTWVLGITQPTCDTSPTVPKFCPFCGSPVDANVPGVFAEAGKYDGKGYAAEGNLTGFRCTNNPDHGFYTWPDGKPLAWDQLEEE